ncbi:hypothetical protein SB751_23250 [Cupriavidus sp. SIMBA_020]|uniref:hypothetical protein n=1 Tax=Cupriavidus sp. SIMBA_020 TaxID=3085766 RepID=UPI00397C4BA3
MTDRTPDDDTDISKIFKDALDADVRRIMSGQVRALSSVNANLLILLVNLSSLLVAKGILTKEEIEELAKPHLAAQPGDLVELHKIRESTFQNYLRGLEVVSASVSERGKDNG